MVAMLHQLARHSDRRVLFLHACDNGAVHAMRDEVLQLVANRPGLAAHFCYRLPSDADRANGCFDSEGFVTRALLQELLCLDDYEFYLCGPPPFMQALYPTLRSLGVEKSRIAYEFFGPATVLEAEAAPVTPAPKPANPATAGDTPSVTFRKSGISAAWDPKAQSLLVFAEEQGLTPEFSCRAGVCGSCKSHLVEGNVTYFEEPLDELAANEVLLCCARPTTAIVLDL
jgi:ferredoxin-NADP reductase